MIFGTKCAFGADKHHVDWLPRCIETMQMDMHAVDVNEDGGGTMFDINKSGLGLKFNFCSLQPLSV